MQNFCDQLEERFVKAIKRLNLKKDELAEEDEEDEEDENYRNVNLNIDRLRQYNYFAPEGNPGETISSYERMRRIRKKDIYQKQAEQRKNQIHKKRFANRLLDKTGKEKLPQLLADRKNARIYDEDFIQMPINERPDNEEIIIFN